MYLSFGDARDHHIPLLGDYLTPLPLERKFYCLQYYQEDGHGDKCALGVPFHSSSVFNTHPTPMFDAQGDHQALSRVVCPAACFALLF